MISKEKALLLAVEKGHEKCVRSLLRARADFTIMSGAGQNSLSLASSLGYVSILETLLSGGAVASINDVNPIRDTALFAAAANGRAESVKLLLDAGADVTLRNIGGATALMMSSSVPVIKLLLAAGASVNDVDLEGSSVLHAAGANGHNAGVICCFYKAGACPTVLDKYGLTPARVARGTGNTDGAQMLEILETKYLGREVD